MHFHLRDHKGKRETIATTNPLSFFLCDLCVLCGKKSHVFFTWACRSFKLFVYIACLLCVNSLAAKVRVLTFHYNEPSFIEIQDKCLKKFLTDDYELIVFNDASSAANERAIQATCDRLNIRCIRFQPEWHESDPLNQRIRTWLQDPTTQRSFLNIPLDQIHQQPSIRHCHVIQYALDLYGYTHDDAVVILDGDAFFIRKMSIKKKLEQFDIFGMTRDVKDASVNYLWVPFIAFDPTKLPDVNQLKFHVAVINQKLQDTGAQSHYYLQTHPNIKCEKTLPKSSHALRRKSDRELKQEGYKQRERRLIRQLPRQSPAEFNIENGILHFRAVSFEQPGHQEKALCLRDFMDKIAKEDPRPE